jgi:hypothetical protein
MPGQNCIPQGNVLIVQETDKPEPDDNIGGGILCFAFESPVEVFSIGMMDLAENRGDFVQVEQADTALATKIDIEGLGNNAVQTVGINKKETTRFCIFILGEGAVSAPTL